VQPAPHGVSFHAKSDEVIGTEKLQGLFARDCHVSILEEVAASIQSRPNRLSPKTAGWNASIGFHRSKKISDETQTTLLSPLTEPRDETRWKFSGGIVR
jgi:hypothetical protein